MEINKNLSEFVWEYVKTHDFCSKTVISGYYVDNFGKGGGNREERRPHQKKIERRVASLFTVMKNLGILSKFSQKTVRVNRGIFDAFSLQDILTHTRNDCVSKKSILIDI